MSLLAAGQGGRHAAGRAFLQRLWGKAIAAVAPENVLPPHLPTPDGRRTVLLAAGKGAARAAQAVAAHRPDIAAGLVIARAGDADRPPPRFRLIEAGHPVPDAASLEAGRAALAFVNGLSPQDRLIVALSGGASSLMAAPAPGLTLADKQQTVVALLRSGLPIEEVNCVRRRLSAVKGGRLLGACQAGAIDLLIASDVIGDDPRVIASGPFTPADDPPDAALDIVLRSGLALPHAVRAHLEAPEDTLRSSSAVRTVIVATGGTLLAAACAEAVRAGLRVIDLGDRVAGESRTQAMHHAQLLGEYSGPPALWLSGGETTVTVTGAGRGGPNGEFALAFAGRISGRDDVAFLAADTDGFDGVSGFAGGLVDGGTAARIAAAGLDLADRLSANDSAPALVAAGDAFAPGATGVNVNDFRAALCAPRDLFFGG